MSRKKSEKWRFFAETSMLDIGYSMLAESRERGIENRDVLKIVLLYLSVKGSFADAENFGSLFTVVAGFG
jgi:hypothetical protein